MKITNLEQFLHTYFMTHQCHIVHAEDGRLSVQLTEDLDKVLMNRPFYWHYMEQTGQKGEPATLTLITDPEQKDSSGEWIHFGSPRLHQMMNHLKQNQHNVKLFQHIEGQGDHVALHPWLVINIKIQYQGKHNKEEFYSIGINLITGVMATNMLEKLNQLTLKMSIADYCYTISPMIKIKSAFKRIERLLDQYVEQQSHEWAIESLETLEEEIQLVNHFFTDQKDEDLKAKEIAELKNRYTPKIKYKVINGGLIYLNQTLNVAN